MSCKVLIYAITLAVSGSAFAADDTAFGIVYGKPVPIEFADKAVGDRTVRLVKVPHPYPGISVYAAKLDADGDVCSVTGYIPAAEQNLVEGAIAGIFLRMTEAYGESINARPLDEVNEAWLWFTADKRQTVTLRRYLGPNFTRAASLEYYSVGSGCE